MIDFRHENYRIKKDGSCILSYENIEDITKNILMDYKPSVFKIPQKLDIEDFALNYLCVSDFDYQYIWTKEKDKEILGITTFSDCNIKLFDRENKKTFSQSYKNGSIILDRSLQDGTRNAQFGITGLHECGHYYLHKNVFEKPDGQLVLEIKENKIVCKGEDIVAYKKTQLKGKDWIEWQATIFAVTVSLNRKALSIVMERFIREYGEKNKFIVCDEDNDQLVNNHILPHLSNVFGISKEAILYRLRKLGYLKTIKEYREEQSQMTFVNFI